MRKLREAIVSTTRLDAFSHKVYVWIIRESVLLGSWETYHPALIYFLARIHPNVKDIEVDPCSPSFFEDINVYEQFLEYYILDLACRQADLARAHTIFMKARYSGIHLDLTVKALLKPLIRGNYIHFFRIKHSLINPWQRTLTDFAEDRMRKHATACMGKSYLVIDKSALETATRRPWDQLKKEEGLAWGEAGENVVIRRIGRK